MDITKLKNNNPIEQITEETVAALTEPIQPQYLLLTLEQYNKIAEYFSTVGNSIVRNTDLISELPTHQELNNLIVQTLLQFFKLPYKRSEQVFSIGLHLSYHKVKSGVHLILFNSAPSTICLVGCFCCT